MIELTTLGVLATKIESGFACGRSNLVEVGLPHLRPFNIGKNGAVDLDEVYRVPPAMVPLSKARIDVGDLLFNNTNSPDLVGKVAYVDLAMDAGFSNHVTRIKLDRSRCEPQYIARYLRWLWLKGFFRAHCNQWISQAAFGSRQLLELRLPLPPLDEQRRIVDILNRAASIERLRAEARDKLRTFVPALFVRMFGDRTGIVDRFACRPLRDIADIGSGITKGRTLDPSDVEEVPYLRVANVQDGRLALAEMKTIPIRRSERSKYGLRPGDLVMTEGGDPDKLGRAALWRGELPYCAHQNHVFRVRAKLALVLPEYLVEVAGSEYGKSYFLSVAKQTTGIASINKTQLGNLPVPIPSLDLQRRFVDLATAARGIVCSADAATETASALSAALMHRLFSEAAAPAQAALLPA